MKSKTIIAALCALVLAGCGGEEPGYTVEEKPLKASFTYSPQKPLEGQTVEFTNTSTNASSYEWNVAWTGTDGKTSNKTYKSKTLSLTVEPGIYSVQLTAENYSKSAQYSAQFSVQAVNRVSVKKYRVNKVVFYDSDGRPWDDSVFDGPDILLGVFDSSGDLLWKESTYKANVDEDDLPYWKSGFRGITYNDLTKSYKLNMYDYDTWFDDLMAPFTFTPKRHMPEYPGEVTLTSGGFSITLSVDWQP